MGYNSSCPWVFVGISSKTYRCGKAGVKFANCIGEHMISVQDFEIICNIFKKYQGKAFQDIQ